MFTASLSDQASAPEPADKDVPDRFPHTAGFPPTEENPENASLQRELLLSRGPGHPKVIKSHPGQ